MESCVEQLIDVTVSVSFKNIVLALTGCAVCVCVYVGQS